MENEEVITPQGDQETTPEPKVEEPVVDAEVATLKAQLEKEAEARRQLTARAQKAEGERKVLEAKIKASSGEKQTLDVEDYIDISASLEGLDQKEKEKLAREHKLTGQPLSEIRKDEDFLLWQSAYREKVEKEKALAPSATQSDSERPMTLGEKLNRVSSLAEKEKLLTENGLYRSPRPKSERANIGQTRGF